MGVEHGSLSVGIPDTVDESSALTPEDTVVEVRRRYFDACDRSRRIAAEHDLEEVFDWRGTSVSLRFVYTRLLRLASWAAMPATGRPWPSSSGPAAEEATRT